MKEEITLDSIEVPVWTEPTKFGIRYRRDSLPIEHPWSEFNYIKNVLKLNPNDFGYKDSVCKICNQPLK